MKKDTLNTGNNVYKRGKYNIIVRDNVIDIFSTFKQSGKKKESGGILLGQVQGNNIYILKASPPNTRDISRRLGFIRDKGNAQLIVDHEFFNSGHKTIYLGEWHTHPEKKPTPSTVDTKMIKGQFARDLNESFLIMIIVGINELNVSLYDGENIIYR